MVKIHRKSHFPLKPNKQLYLKKKTLIPKFTVSPLHWRVFALNLPNLISPWLSADFKEAVHIFSHLCYAIMWACNLPHNSLFKVATQINDITNIIPNMLPSVFYLLCQNGNGFHVARSHWSLERHPGEGACPDGV